MNAAVITEGSLEYLNGSITRKETIRLLYVSRSAAVSAHCLLWIERSPIEPLHFGDFSIFDYTAIEIRTRRASPLPQLGGAAASPWLTDEIDTRVASYQALRFNPPLIADIVPSFLFTACDCNTQPSVAHKRNDRSYVVCVGFFLCLIASNIFLLPGFKCRRNFKTLFRSGCSAGWSRDA